MSEPNHTQEVKSGSDRRYIPRWEVENRVIYRLEHQTQNYEAQSRDINCSGACIATKEPLPSEQKVKLTVYLDSATPVYVEGKVLWNEPARNFYLTGIAFHEVSKKAQDLILKYAFEIKKADLVKHWFKGWEGQGH